MTSEQTSLLYQEYLKNSSYASLFASQQANALQGGYCEGQQSLQEVLQARLIQTVLEEKMKNEILMAAVLINSKIIELQNQIVQETQPNLPNKPCFPQNESTVPKLEEAPSESSSEKDHHTTNDCELKRPANSRRIKNETKNIPKNYGKAIISFIEKNQRLVKRILAHSGNPDYTSFMATIRLKKRKVNSIADLRSLWVDEQNSFAKATRILSSIFLKKHSLPYIFNSRVTNFQGHIKYRYRLIEALREPKQFTSIKMF